MESIYTTANPSSSVVYGNVAAFIKEYLVSKFPANFFKYKTISTELSYRNILQQMRESENLELSKRQKPYLVIKPLIQSLSNGDMFLYDIPMTKNYYDIEYGMDKRYLFSIIKDKENGYSLLFKLNRDKFEFDITVTVSTQIQQIDWWKYMQNEFTWDIPMAITTSFENIIPNDVIFHIANLTNIPINDDNSHNIPILLDKMNQYSKYPITYKMRNATSKDEFFMFYSHQILITLSDLTPEEGTKHDMIDDSYNITFHITAEFNLPGMYILMGTKPDLYLASLNLLAKQQNSDDYDTVHISPLYTMHNMFADFTSRLDGFRLMLSSIISIDRNNKSGTETIDISSIFTKDEMQIIKNNHKFISNIDTLLRIVITEDNRIMDFEKYKMDWNTMILTINSIDISSTYRLFIYQNSIKFNDELLEISYNKNLNN